MRPKNLDLVAVVLIACAGVATMASGATFAAIQAVFALPLILFLPGYASTAALFPPPFEGPSQEPTPARLNPVETLLLSFGLSLAVTALCGYVLNLVPSGLNRTSWAVVLGSVTVLLTGAAYVRRPATSAGARRIRGVSARPIVILGLALLLVIGSLSIASNAALKQAGPGFTQMWMLPSRDATSRALRLGVRSHELSTVQYKLEVEGIRKAPLSIGPITLRPGATWETTIILSQKRRGALSVLLFRSDRPNTVYRRVTWKSLS